jgi:hypothetical protein
MGSFADATILKTFGEAPNNLDSFERHFCSPATLS